MKIEQTNNICQSFYAGDTISWINKIANIQQDEFNLSYVLINSQNKILINAVYDSIDDNFKVELTSTQTKNYKDGSYTMVGILTKISDSNVRYTFNLESIVINQDLSVANKEKENIWVEALRNIDCFLAGNASSEIENYSLSGRSLKYWDWDQLMKKREFYKQKVDEYNFNKFGVKSQSNTIYFNFVNK